MNNFTPRAQQVLALARREAGRLNHHYVGTEHLLLGLIRLDQGVAVNVLQKLGLDLETVRIAVEKESHPGTEPSTASLPYSPRVKKVLAFAGKEARSLNHSFVGTEHLLLGLLREGDGVASRVLKTFEIDFKRTRHDILQELEPTYSVPDGGIDSSPVSENPVPTGEADPPSTPSEIAARLPELTAERDRLRLNKLEQEVWQLRHQALPAIERLPDGTPFTSSEKLQEEIRQIREDFFQKFDTVLGRLDSLAADLNRLRDDVLKGKS